MRSTSLRALVALVASSGFLAAAWAAVVPAAIVVKVGDAVSGSTVSSLNSPFTDGRGKVSFVAALADSNRVVWKGSGVIFNSSSALPDVLTGGEGTMGSGDSGGFIYSPSFNGLDAVYTNAGKLLADDDVAPGIAGQFITFCSRPQMGANDTAYWVSGYTATLGGATQARVLYSATNVSNPGTITPVVKGGDVVSGLTIAAQGIEFPYKFSDNGLHRINRLTMVTAAANDAIIAVDGVMVAQEGMPTGDGDNHQAFRDVYINNDGDWVLIGDTNATNDDFLMLNGSIKVRQAQVVDGITLGSTVDAASNNNVEQMAFIWDTSTTTEGLFVGSAANVQNSQVVLATNDLLDTNGDGTGDWTLNDFNVSSAIGPGLDFAENGKLYLEVDITPAGGGTTVEAIIEVKVCVPCDLNCDGSVNPFDINDFLLVLGGGTPCSPCAGDANGDGTANPFDINTFLDCLSN